MVRTHTTRSEGASSNEDKIMKTSQNSVSHKRISTWSRLFTLCLVGLLAACSNPLDSGDGDEEIIDDNPIVEEPAAKMYNVRMRFRRIDVDGDCDRDGVIAGLVRKNPGEIAYRIEYSTQNADGSWSGKTVVDQTDGYGRSDGKHESKTDDNRVITIDKNINVRLEDDLNYRMHFSAIEWDGNSRDSRMDGDEKIETNSTGGSVLDYSHAITLGSGSCKLVLHTTATETEV